MIQTSQGPGEHRDYRGPKRVYWVARLAFRVNKEATRLPRLGLGKRGCRSFNAGIIVGQKSRQASPVEASLSEQVTFEDTMTCLPVLVTN